MKKSKGFFLVQEVICFCLCCLLMTGLVSALVRCLALQRQNEICQQSLIAAQQAFVGEEPLLPVKRSVSEKDDLRFVELEVQYEQSSFNLLWAKEP